MSSSCAADHHVAAAEQLCYIPCNFCNIVLAVSVPCNNLLDMVTVRCGHCANLWSVNMAAAFHQSLSWQNLQAHQNYYGAQEMRTEKGSSSRCNGSRIPVRAPQTNIPSDHHKTIINRPPEKRQRMPSAYNQFIKEEIQRIKANNPEISHREAFSTAAKNVSEIRHIYGVKGFTFEKEIMSLIIKQLQVAVVW